MSQIRVVIADDESIIRMDLKEILENAGHSVVGSAKNGREALELAEALHPDLVILDIKMPKLNGLTAAERIAKQTLAPVILLTAYKDKRFVEKARKGGVYTYLVKPFREEELLAAVDLAISRFEEMRAIESELATVKQKLEGRKIIDRAKGRIMDELKLTEGDAFHLIQKLSMDKRRTLSETAKEILTEKPSVKGGLLTLLARYTTASKTISR